MSKLPGVCACICAHVAMCVYVCAKGERMQIFRTPEEHRTDINLRTMSLSQTVTSKLSRCVYACVCICGKRKSQPMCVCVGGGGSSISLLWVLWLA